jgi:hypothetical protein
VQQVTYAVPQIAVYLFYQRKCRLFRFYVDLLLDDDRKREGECRPLADNRVNPNPSAVHLDNAFRYRLGRMHPIAKTALLAIDARPSIVLARLPASHARADYTASRLPFKKLAVDRERVACIHPYPIVL